MKYIIFLIAILPALSFAQSVGIGTQNPNSSAILDITSTSKGLLIPRITEQQRNAIANPATGLLVWQTNGTSGFYYNNGTPQAAQWLMLSAALDTDWKLTGNSNTDSATHFLGSINQAPLYFRARNTWAGQVDSGKGTHFGYKAGWMAPDKYNTAFGTEALSAPSEGGRNTAFGYFAAKEIRTGQGNTAMGSEALSKNTSGTSNTAIGALSMENNITGVFNTALGAYTLQTAEAANFNTAVGYLALRYNTANSNTAFGSHAMLYNTSGADNTALGRLALNKNTSGGKNTATGFNSLANNTLGSSNTAIGWSSLSENTIGHTNTAVGQDAASMNTSGTGITAIGSGALQNSMTATHNTAVGSLAMHKNTTGALNVAVGAHSMLDNTTGEYLTAVGYQVLRNNTTGSESTGLGLNALHNNTSGNANVAVGFQSGLANTTGSGNTFLGYLATANSSNRSNATALGRRAIVGCNNCLVLGSVAGQNGAAESVNVGIGTTTPNEVLTINGTNPIMQLQHEGSSLGFIQITSGQDVKIGTNADNNLGSFFVRTNGADRMKVDPTGNVGVGTSSASVKFQVGANGDGTVARANAWQTFSDERFKKDITPIGNALDKLEALQGYYYHWNSGIDSARQAGFLAQEVEEVMPEIVSTDNDGYKSVDYGKMNALLLQAVKEQNELIKKMQKEIEQLKMVTRK